MALKTLKGKCRVCLATTANYGDVVNAFHDVIQDNSDTSTTYYDDRYYRVYTGANQTAVLAQCLSDLGTARRDELSKLLTEVVALPAPATLEEATVATKEP